MAFWNKKKENGKKGKEQTAEEPEEKPTRHSYGTTAKLEEIKAKIGILNEEKKVNEEKFSRLHEQIGEIRASSIETEKSIQSLVTKAERASSLVGEVHPEKLLAEVKKIQVRVEALEGKTDLGKQVSDNIIKQVKSINKAVSAFRGVEQVAKESQRLRERMDEIKKLERQMDLHADQIEKRYLKFQKRYLDFKRNKKIIHEARKLQYELQKEVQKHDRVMTGFATKEELVDLENDFRSRIEFISGYREEKSVLGAFKRWVKKGNDNVDPAPMPVLFSMNPKKKHYITFKWDSRKRRWYLDIEEMVEEQTEEEPVVTEEAEGEKSEKKKTTKKRAKRSSSKKKKRK